MSSMVERVARAFKVELAKDGFLDPEWSGSDESCARYATAAIAALRDPTPEMVEAAVEGTGPVGCCAIGDKDATEIWSAMIDAASKEGG